MATVASEPRVGPLIREWRNRRRLSQLALALDAGISARHLSFLETGRSRPSAEMVLRLAEELEVPFRERNRMLLAAGHAPVYEERALSDPDMGPVRAAIDSVLKGHEPYPAVVVDRLWNVVAGNSALSVLIEGASPELLEPPVNVLRLSLHPEGVATRLLNLGEVRAHLLERLARQVMLTGDPELAELLSELASYPGPEHEHGPGSDAGAREIFTPVRIRDHEGEGELAFFSTIATFGTAAEITTSELAIESFFPADEATARRLERLARG